MKANVKLIGVVVSMLTAVEVCAYLKRIADFFELVNEVLASMPLSSLWPVRARTEYSIF